MAAYTLSAVSFTVAMVLGPVLVSGLLLLGGPQAAVLTAAGLAGGGGLLFAVTPASRRWVPAMAPRRPLRWPGRGMRTLIAGNLAIGLAPGLAGIAVPAAVTGAGKPAHHNTPPLSSAHGLDSGRVLRARTRRRGQ